MAHTFHNPPRDGSDFTCATLDFDGAEHNPLVVALPALVLVPLDQVDGLQPALDLLFAETDRVRCGSRLLADRLFEVVLIQLLRWLIDHPGASGVGSGLITGLADPRLARLLVALHAAPAEAWPLERMAVQAGMSRTAFAVTFKQATGATPAGYLADWRLTLAMSELRAGGLLKAVADAVGTAAPRRCPKPSSSATVWRRETGARRTRGSTRPDQGPRLRRPRRTPPHPDAGQPRKHHAGRHGPLLPPRALAKHDQRHGGRQHDVRIGVGHHLGCGKRAHGLDDQGIGHGDAEVADDADGGADPR